MLDISNVLRSAHLHWLYSAIMVSDTLEKALRVGSFKQISLKKSH